MTAQIRATRLEVTDRFPMLGFTIRTDGVPQRAEVAIATDAKLFSAANKAQRTLSNFYSSRAGGPLSVPRGEAVYVVPSEVLARFVGNDRLYVALAAMADRTGAVPVVEVLPTEGSPYISLKGLTGRSLKRVRLLPNRQQRAAGYGVDEQSALEWAGDTAQPGQQPVPAVPTAPSQPQAPPTSASGNHDYDDGFGPMPPPPTADTATRIASVAPVPVPANSNGGEKPVTSQGYGSAQALGAYSRPYSKPFLVEPYDRWSSWWDALTTQLRHFASGAMWFLGVSDTTNPPYSAICQVRRPDGTAEGAHVGTAFFIAPRLLLTAAHVVDGESELIIVPGKNGAGTGSSSEPFGRFHVTQFQKHGSYGVNGRDNDMALICVPAANAASAPNYFDLVEELTQSRPEGVVVSGYAAWWYATSAIEEFVNNNIDENRQHAHGGYIRELPTDGTFSYDLQTLAGTSGSPVYWIEDGAQPRAHLVGVHVAAHDNTTNLGCRITQEKLGWIRATAAAWGQTLTFSLGLARGLEDAGAFVAGQDDPDAIGIREDEPVDAALAASAQSIRARTFDAPLPDYPDASRFVPAHANNFTPRRRSDRVIDRIVIHITAGGPSIDGTIAWFQNGNRVNERTGKPIRSSAHYIVGRDGEVVQMVRNAHTAHHASAANSRSIGIEHNANKPSRGNPRDLPPTEPQYEASARLVTWLCQQYNLPVDREHIVGHQEISPGDNHDCPTSYWDWDYFMALLRPAAGAGGTVPEAGALPQNLGYPRRAYAIAQEIITPYYDPADPASALTCQADAFSQAREEWFAGVPNTMIFPHSAICLLEMSDGSGNISRGTGFYIGPNRILTCAHNLYNMASVTIIPGKNGNGGASTEPFGRATVTSGSWRIPASYAGSNKGTDLAVIDDVPLAAPNGMWFDELEELNQSRPEGVVVCGYSSRSERVPDLTRAIDGFRQHLHAGYIASLADDDSTFSYPILTLKRASGSPVYYLSDRSGSMRAYVVGVHTGADADDLNRGCRLMQAKIDWIEGRTTALSLGTAQRPASRFSVRAMSNDPFSLTWDEVELVPQRYGSSCWAAAASMVIGWRDQVSIDEATLAAISGRAPDQRGPLADADVRAFASALGLAPQSPQSYTVEGFRQLLESNGPVWVCKQMGGGVPDSGHAVVVVGMYSDGNTAYVRIADPWDRVVGSPGAPGVYLDTHATGSRYIMTYSDFVAEYEWQQQLDNASPPNERIYPLQILHSGGTQGRLPNYGSPPAGYAQGLGERREVRLPQPPKARSGMLGLPALRRVSGGAGGVNYALDQYDDMKAPSGMAVAGSAAPVPGPTLNLSDWPYLDGPSGRIYGAVRIDWRYVGGMVGNVAISVPNSRAGDGYSLSITAGIADGPDTAAVAALRITLRHEFSHPGETTLVAVTEVTLYGDGRHERQNRWDAPAQARAA